MYETYATANRSDAWIRDHFSALLQRVGGSSDRLGERESAFMVRARYGRVRRVCT